MIEQAGAPRGDVSADIEQVTRILPISFVVAGTGAIGLYLMTHAWQNLAIAGIGYFLVVAFLGARYLVRKGHPSAAIAVILITPQVMLLLASLLWEGNSLILAILAGGIAGVLVAMLVRSKARYWLWGIASANALLILVVGRMRLPWSRFNVASSPLAFAGSQVPVIALLIAVVMLFVRSYRRALGIRSRLTLLFIVLVLGVALATTVSSIWLGIRTTERRTFDQLRTAVALQEQMVNNWIGQLTYALDSLVVEDYEVQRAQSLLMESLPADFRLQAAHSLRARFRSLIRRTGWFSEIFLINRDGYVVLSTLPWLEGRYVGEEPYFEPGLVEHYLAPPAYDPTVGYISLVLVRPLRVGNFTYGILAARADMSQLIQIAESSASGRKGRTYFVGMDQALLTEPTTAGRVVLADSVAIRTALEQRDVVGQGTYVNHMGVPVLGAYTWLPRLRAVLITEQDRSEVLAGARMTSFVNGGVALVATLFAVLAAFRFAEGIAKPLSNLAETATRISEGALDMEATVEREDEVGAVARAFNAMTAQLRDLIGSLEQRVQERTRGLQAVTEVSRATTSVLDPDRLLPQVVDMVQQRFDLYYVGLFLLDPEGVYAVLQAGTGEAGAAMLAEGWRLEVGGESMIGQCVARGEPLAKQQVTDEVMRLANPYLPETRSELALPLRYGDRVIGAMTVQSTEEMAFGETEISVFQNLADQVAVAVQNARLFAETQAALERARRIQQRYLSRAWSDYLQARRVTGYDWHGAQLTPLEDRLLPEVRDGLAVGHSILQDGRLRIPIVQAGQVVGVLGIERPEGWNEDEVALVEALVEQLTLAAENQRLLDDISQRAAMERTIGEVTAAIRSETEIESVLERALSTLGEVLDADRGKVWLTLEANQVEVDR